MIAKLFLLSLAGFIVLCFGMMGLVYTWALILIGVWLLD